MKKNKTKIKVWKWFHKLLRYTLQPILFKMFNIEGDYEAIKNLKPPFIVLGNHTNYWDPFLVSIFIKPPIYFVASDENFRRFWLNIVMKILGAIPKTKFVSDLETVKTLVRLKERGEVIGIFPEGARTWDGKPLPIIKSTSKLIKLLKIPVVTVIVKGGYLSFPRWAKKTRKGKMIISYKISLTKDESKSYSVEKIHKIISKDLNSNDYDFQKENKIKYKGKDLAEYLELLLFVCPSCKNISTLESEKNIFYCKNCNLKTKYTEEGYLKFISKHNDFNTKKFENPQYWNEWQIKYLKEYFKSKLKNKHKNKILLIDKNVIMFTSKKAKPLQKVNVGNLILNEEGIIFSTMRMKNFHFNLDRIYGENVQRSTKFEFYYNNKLHRFHFLNKRISAYKWVKSIKILKELNNIKTPDMY